MFDGVRRWGMGIGELVFRRVRRFVCGVVSECVEFEWWCVEFEFNYCGVEDEEWFCVIVVV